MRRRRGANIETCPWAQTVETDYARLEIKVEDCSNSVHLPIRSAASVILVLKIPLNLSMFGNGKGRANRQRSSTPFAKSAVVVTLRLKRTVKL